MHLIPTLKLTEVEKLDLMTLPRGFETSMSAARFSGTLIRPHALVVLLMLIITGMSLP